jgi:hypothetical protein
MANPSVVSLIGPWSQALDEGERKARIRSMRAVAGCYLGWDHRLVAALGRAEGDPRAMVEALTMLELMPTRTRRHIWAGYGAAQPNNAPAPPANVLRKEKRVFVHG